MASYMLASCKGGAAYGTLVIPTHFFWSVVSGANAVEVQVRLAKGAEFKSDQSSLTS